MKTRSTRSVAAVVAVIAVVGGARAAGIPRQGTWETTLQARDLTGDGVADAYYDSVLNITWLRDANVNGAVYIPLAMLWANNLTVGGVSGWRLPRMVISDLGCFNVNFYAGGADCGFNVRTTSNGTVYSEMASLWYDTLGNKSYFTPGTGISPQPGWDSLNTGAFLNLQTLPSDRYWFEQPDFAHLDWSSTRQWAFYMGNGGQGIENAYGNFSAMAVHPGDVGVALVPEPQTYAMLLAGLAGLAVATRRRHSMLA